MVDFSDRLKELHPYVTGEVLRTLENMQATPCSDGGVQINIEAGGVVIEIVLTGEGKVHMINQHISRSP